MVKLGKFIYYSKFMDIQKRIDIFRSVRDLAYRLPLTREDITCNDTSCIGKSRLLYEKLQPVYPVRYRLYQFFWSEADLPVDVAQKIRVDEGNHCVVEIYLNGDWITLDPSWDKDLGAIFSVNDWDGMHSTPISIPYREKLSLAASRQKAKNELFALPERLKDTKLNREFYRDMNNIFEQIRKINK